MEKSAGRKPPMNGHFLIIDKNDSAVTRFNENRRAFTMIFFELHSRVRHPRNYDYYWLVGDYTNTEPDAEDTDNWALTHGYIAITPTTIDVTSYEMIDQMKNWKF